MAGRTQLLRSIIDAIQRDVPELAVMVRLSVFDTPPFVTSREIGRPMDYQRLLPYAHGFGVNPENPMEMDLTEPIELLRELHALGGGGGESLLWQPVLQPPRPAAGYFSSQRTVTSPPRIRS